MPSITERNTASIQHNLGHVVTPAGIFHIAWKALSKQHCQSINYTHAIDQLIICWPIPTANSRFKTFNSNLPPKESTSLQMKSLIRNSSPRTVCLWKASSLNTQPLETSLAFFPYFVCRGRARLEKHGQLFTSRKVWILVVSIYVFMKYGQINK